MAQFWLLRFPAAAINLADALRVKDFAHSKEATLYRSLARAAIALQSHDHAAALLALSPVTRPVVSGAAAAAPDEPLLWRCVLCSACTCGASRVRAGSLRADALLMSGRAAAAAAEYQRYIAACKAGAEAFVAPKCASTDTPGPVDAAAQANCSLALGLAAFQHRDYPASVAAFARVGGRCGSLCRCGLERSQCGGPDMRASAAGLLRLEDAQPDTAIEAATDALDAGARAAFVLAASAAAAI
jgi:hypothetical protein